MSICSTLGRQALDYAVSQAHTLYPGRPVCVAVCDAAGFLLAFLRMEESPLRCIDISRQKAHTAVRMGSSTEDFQKRLEREKLLAADFCDPLLTPIPGGQPVLDLSGRIIGAVGISGLAPAEDQALARMVADFLVGQLEKAA